MPAAPQFIVGEFQRTVDERWRLSLPSEMCERLVQAEPADCILVKERSGCISLWDAATWKTKVDKEVDWVKQKIQAGKLEDQYLPEVQLLGRLLSTRHRPVQLAGRGRLLIPEGFREFLGVELGGEVTIVGAAVCIEIWNPAAWVKYLQRRIPKFQRLLRRLSG
jgi:MraZ protein